MTLHFEIDQEIKGCRNCIFSNMDDSFGECYCLMGGGIQNGKIAERLIGTAPLSKDEERLWDQFDDTPPDWCPCVKVDDNKEISICNYYRQQDGRCRATRDCEWEGCNGDRSKCPHNKINLLK